MVIVAKPSKPFTYTAKNTARRQAIIQAYNDEIDALYDAVEEIRRLDISPPLSWSIASTIDFIRTVVKKVLVRPVLDDDDIFDYGCDRYVRSQIVYRLLPSFPFSPFLLQFAGHLDLQLPTPRCARLCSYRYSKAYRQFCLHPSIRYTPRVFCFYPRAQWRHRQWWRHVQSNENQ